MITMKDFKTQLNWSMKEFNEAQVNDIYNAIQTEGYQSVEEIRQAEEDGDLMDCTTSWDVNIVPLLENLEALDEQKIVDLINSNYGERISIHYLQQDEMFAMIIGHH